VVYKNSTHASANNHHDSSRKNSRSGTNGLVGDVQTGFIYYQFGIRLRLPNRLFTIFWNFRASFRHVLQASPTRPYIPRSASTPWKGFGFLCSCGTTRSSPICNQPTSLVDYGA
jgi:hypothetical protein